MVETDESNLQLTHHPSHADVLWTPSNDTSRPICSDSLYLIATSASVSLEFIYKCCYYYYYYRAACNADAV